MTVPAQNVVLVQLASTGMKVKGLSPGTWIATAGVDYLKEGQEVRILSEAKEETP